MPSQPNGAQTPVAASAANAWSSEVLLIVDTRSTVAAKLSDEVGSVQGQGDDDLRMDDVSIGTEIDLTADPVEVFTVSYQVAGQRGIYPTGLLIGTVSQVYEASNCRPPDSRLFTDAHSAW